MPAKQETRSETSADFETNLRELEALVGRLEAGDLSLEDSLKQFERGIALSRACQQALKTAEQKVQILTEKNGETTLEPFEASNAERAD